MARLSIIWRNPGSRKIVRCWTNVRRDPRRSLYMILESGASGPSSWRGLPALEVVRRTTAERRAENPSKLLSGA